MVESNKFCGYISPIYTSPLNWFEISYILMSYLIQDPLESDSYAKEFKWATINKAYNSQGFLIHAF